MNPNMLIPLVSTASISALFLLICMGVILAICVALFFISLKDHKDYREAELPEIDGESDDDEIELPDLDDADEPVFEEVEDLPGEEISSADELYYSLKKRQSSGSSPIQKPKKSLFGKKS